MELKNLKSEIDRAKNMKNKAEGTLEELKKQEKQYLDELSEMGIEPENLEAEIERLRLEIDKDLKEANALIPHDILNRGK